MGWRDWFRTGVDTGGAGARSSGRWDGRAGVPPSGNGASSFHLFWEAPPGRWTAVEATIEVVEPPRTRDLSFWALQAGFAGPAGGGGAAHLGLQWYPAHPGNTAVNWGGYGPDGAILDGSRAFLPSATGNPNTRDFTWHAGRAYRLAIAYAGLAPDGLRSAFRGSVTDLETGDAVVVRDLFAPGDHLDGPVVWSEVFAPCDAPPAAVRWSDLAVLDGAGRRTVVDRVTVNYQSLTDGGCVTSDVEIDDRGVLQRTGHERVTAQGTVIVVPPAARWGVRRRADQGLPTGWSGRT